MKAVIIFILLCLSGPLVTAQTRYKIDNQGMQIDGYFYAASNQKAPAIVALHGCSGMLGTKGNPNNRTQAYAKFLNSQGWHVLFVDSLTPRGVKSVCGVEPSPVPPQMRVADVQAASKWLASRTEVDAARIGVLGWSHGGSVTILANEVSVSYDPAPVAFHAFYPGCGTNRAQQGWRPAKPLLMQLGGEDDWTNPSYCQSLASRWSSSGLVEQVTYPNAGHGFDSGAPVVARKLPNGKTVHAGGDPAGFAASQIKLIAFFKEHFK